MTDEHIIAYLLEELPEEESERFEAECFAQESWPSQISFVEEDLIDAYLRGELSPQRRQRFEQNYLTTEARRERVVMASALLSHIAEQAVEEHSAFDQQPASDEHPVTVEHSTVAKATVEVSPAALTWAGRFHAFWSGQSRVLRATAALASLAIIAGAVWFTLLRTPPPKTFATLTLTNANSTRADGARASKVLLPLGADALRINLTLPARLPPASRFRIEWENVDGELKPLEIAGQDAQSVSVLIPAAQLKRGQYALNLFVIESDGTELPVNGSYFFTVG